MWSQLLDRLARALRSGASVAWRAAREIGRLVWLAVRGPLLATLNILTALIVLFEEWGWRPLVALLGRLVQFKLWARLELWIAGLPPYGALAVIALPTTILFPLKFVAVFLLARGFVVTATTLFAAAKIASTALIARIFLLTKPSLMQIAWFAQAYGAFVQWHDTTSAVIRSSWVWRYGRMLKRRVRLAAIRAWIRCKPKLNEAWRTARRKFDEWRAVLAPKLRLEWLRLRLTARRVWRSVLGA